VIHAALELWAWVFQATGSEKRRMQAERSLKRPSRPRAKISATHSLKERVMESLDHKEPQTTRALSQKLGLHQSSVSHTLKELMEEDLVIKKGKSYLLSNVGIIQNNVQKWMGKTLRCLEDHKDFFLSHDLSGIPLVFQVTMGVVCDAREIIMRPAKGPDRGHPARTEHRMLRDDRSRIEQII
jgi:DNA-binding transcriptional ArsR family regulator